MARLLDIGLDRISSLLIDMASLSVNSVSIALDAFERGNINKLENFDYSEKLRVLQFEVADYATELIARFQPVARDLRYIHSCLDISYGFSRFGRYAYDIASLMETIGPIEECDKSNVIEMGGTVKNMINLSVKALKELDKDASKRLYMMDDSVDTRYRSYLRHVLTQPDGHYKTSEIGCYVSTLLILRYLERISDHACYIGDCVHYIVTADPSPRR